MCWNSTLEHHAKYLNSQFSTTRLVTLAIIEMVLSKMETAPTVQFFGTETCSKMVPAKRVPFSDFIKPATLGNAWPPRRDRYFCILPWPLRVEPVHCDWRHDKLKWDQTPSNPVVDSRGELSGADAHTKPFCLSAKGPTPSQLRPRFRWISWIGAGVFWRKTLIRERCKRVASYIRGNGASSCP